MGYTKAHTALDGNSTEEGLSGRLELKNLGFSVYILGRGEGYDFFHNHREQEEVYMCLEGSADLAIGGAVQDGSVHVTETVELARGDIVRVDPSTLRAIGNTRSDRAVLLIAGACSHTYPGFGDHDVISDVLQVVGRGATGFEWPASLPRDDQQGSEEVC